jgi:hypothetical protein
VAFAKNLGVTAMLRLRQRGGAVASRRWRSATTPVAVATVRRSASSRSAPEPVPQLTGAEVLVSTLISSGVKDVFGIPGTHTVPIYKALETRSDQIKHTLTRHEQGASFAVEGYARASGRMAVCTITGVGVTNTLTAMASANAPGGRAGGAPGKRGWDPGTPMPARQLRHHLDGCSPHCNANTTSSRRALPWPTAPQDRPTQAAAGAPDPAVTT